MNTYPHKQICYLSWLHKVTNHDILSTMYLLHAMSSGMTHDATTYMIMSS